MAYMAAGRERRVVRQVGAPPPWTAQRLALETDELANGNRLGPPRREGGSCGLVRARPGFEPFAEHLMQKQLRNDETVMALLLC
jgi:hypothetical protein